MRPTLWLWLLAFQLCARISLTAPATFGLTNIWTIELHATPDGWRTLIGSRSFTPVDITVNSQTYTNVAVRQKGGGTSGGAEIGAPGLHLNFKGHGVAGVKHLSLNNNFFDTSCLRDVLSYKVCSDFEVPSLAFQANALRTTMSPFGANIDQTVSPFYNASFDSERVGVP